jgi:ATP-dependent Clp protease adaptor protein ClpS
MMDSATHRATGPGYASQHEASPQKAGLKDCSPSGGDPFALVARALRIVAIEADEAASMNARSDAWLQAGPPNGDDDADDDGKDGDFGTAVITRTKPKTKKPSMYRVLLLNDDYTPMEFVVHVLERFFSKNIDEATQIMLHVHHNGVGECGIFTYEVAETKVTQVMDFARKHQHPLQCVMEKK